MDKNFSYPIFLDIKDRKCVVIGGGSVAVRKCKTLLKAGAKVVVISPDLSKEMKTLKDNGQVVHINRKYMRGDLEDAFMVIAATDNGEINRQVAEDANAKGILVNVVDNPSLCNFILPAIFRRDPLTIAISTGGASPAFAREIKEELKKLYGPEVARQLKRIKKQREKILKEVKSRKEREKLLRQLVREIHRPG